MPLNSVLVLFFFFFFFLLGWESGKANSKECISRSWMCSSCQVWTEPAIQKLEFIMSPVLNISMEQKLNWYFSMGTDWSRTFPVRPRTVDLIYLGQSKIIGISLQLQLYYFTETPSTSNLLCIWLTLLQTLLSSATGCTRKFHSRGIHTDNQLETSLTVHAETGKYCL